jgi:hypothetical protein
LAPITKDITPEVANLDELLDTPAKTADPKVVAEVPAAGTAIEEQKPPVTPDAPVFTSGEGDLDLMPGLAMPKWEPEEFESFDQLEAPQPPVVPGITLPPVEPRAELPDEAAILGGVESGLAYTLPALEPTAPPQIRRGPELGPPAEGLEYQIRGGVKQIDRPAALPWRPQPTPEEVTEVEPEAVEEPAEEYSSFDQLEQEIEQEGKWFDPLGEGYDFATARAKGLEANEFGNFPSTYNLSGQEIYDIGVEWGSIGLSKGILLGREHPRFQDVLKSENAKGNEVYRLDRDARYISVPRWAKITGPQVSIGEVEPKEETAEEWHARFREDHDRISDEAKNVPDDEVREFRKNGGHILGWVRPLIVDPRGFEKLRYILGATDWEIKRHIAGFRIGTMGAVGDVVSGSRRGAWHSLNRSLDVLATNPLTLVPFLHDVPGLVEDIFAWDAAKRLDNGTESAEDRVFLKKYVDKQMKLGPRPYETGPEKAGRVMGDVAASLPAFILELYLTKGVYKFGKAKLNAYRKLFKTRIKRNLFRALRTSLAGGLQGSAALQGNAWKLTFQENRPGLQVGPLGEIMVGNRYGPDGFIYRGT